jgi:hypothetical protein
MYDDTRQILLRMKKDKIDFADFLAELGTNLKYSEDLNDYFTFLNSLTNLIENSSFVKLEKTEVSKSIDKYNNDNLITEINNLRNEQRLLNSNQFVDLEFDVDSNNWNTPNEPQEFFQDDFQDSFNNQIDDLRWL